MDAARYGLYSWVTASEKPQDLVIRETLAPLAQQGDLTSAYIRYLQMKERQEENEDWHPI